MIDLDYDKNVYHNPGSISHRLHFVRFWEVFFI